MKYVYSPETYFKLSKMDYLQDFMQFEQEDRKDDLALGGVYEIDFTENDDKVHIAPGNFVVKKCELIPYDPQKYDYKVGDSVIVKPICTEEEKKYLKISYESGCCYKIGKIINKFYAKLITDKPYLGMPIRFCDIEKIE